MATQALQQPRWVHNIYGAPRRFFGGEEEKNFYLEAASQTYDRGAFVYQTSGKLAVITATSKIFGQAFEDATGTTSTRVYGARILPGDVFEVNVYHATAASALAALTQLGECYALKLVSGTIVLDIETTAEDGTTANARWKLVGYRDPIGDVYGRVYAQVLEYSFATDGNPLTRILQGA